MHQQRPWIARFRPFHRCHLQDLQGEHRIGFQPNFHPGDGDDGGDGDGDGDVHGGGDHTSARAVSS